MTKRKGKIQEKIEEYFDQKKNIYELFMSFLEQNSYNPKVLQKLLKEFEKQKLLQDSQEFEHFLYLIVNISNNYHLDDEYFDNIKQLLEFLSTQIVKTFSNIEIFNIFSTNKLILLFLFEKNIIYMDDEILNIFLENQDSNGIKYCHFFLPEIQKFIEPDEYKEIENEASKFDPDYNIGYDIKRHIGQNNSYICELIRADDVINFISYVNLNRIRFSSEIKPSIYETNPFLMDKNTTFIEYAAYFGSVQIFRFLFMNNIEINGRLFEYAIHSKNPELVHFFEENLVIKNNQIYERVYFESIKCHYNDISNYIEQNLLIESSNEQEKKIFEEKKVLTSLKYSNYFYIPDDFEQNYGLYYLCKYKYSKIVKLFMKMKKEEIKDIIVAFFIFL